ncbi:hypothetical protein KAJ61_00285 [Candidatus Parcubacteria bacterium]|nr:hypothetical protein [Candidatus Parcubacteria bacterium]
MNQNNHIEKYLKYYCNAKNITPFTVLLKGKWGCGKTYFIKKFIKKQKGNFFHVSLYGLSNFDEINEKIIIELLPLISTKYNKIASSLFKKIKDIPIIKKWVPPDSNELIIDIFLKNKRNETVLIFDDVERCDIAIDKLFGYINHFVEFKNQKIILIANEEEILKLEYKSKYREIKEKLIGKEFFVNPSPQKAIKIFTQDISCKNLKDRSEKVKKLLLEIFKQSNCNNLRLIQQALSDFEYFFENLQDEIQRNTEIFKKMFYEFIVIFIEHKSGKIKSKDFFKEWPQFFKGVSEEDREKKHFLDKYDNLSHFLTCFDVKILGKILQGISLSKDEKSNLDIKIQQLIGINEESWKKLWYFEDYSDEDFFKNLKDVQNKWKNKKYSDFFVVIHILGIFLNFSEIKFIEKSKKDILKEGKKYIDYLIQNKIFPLDLKERKSGFGWKNGSYGLGYVGSKTSEWKNLLDFIDKKTEELREASIKEKIKNELMPILKGEKEIDQSLDLLINYNFLHDGAGKGIAYFQYFDVKEVVKILMQGGSSFLVLKEIFKKRYTERNQAIKDIKKEIPFIEKLKEELEKEIKKIEKKFNDKKTPKSFLLRGFIDEALIKSDMLKQKLK